MRTATLLASGLTLLAASGAYAQQAANADATSGRQAEAALSNTALQLRYMTSGDKVGVDDGSLSVGAFFSEERDVVLTGAVLVPLDLNLGRRMSLRLGPQVYAALLEDENNDVFAVAAGVEARYVLDRRRDMAVVGSAYYSPDIITFGSADNITDMAARLELRLMRSVVGFVGYRWFELDLLAREERELQEEFFAGLRWRFE